jgi:transposase
MEHYAGIDVSLDTVSVCIVDGTGKVLREAKVASEPDALVAWFGELGFVLERIGMVAAARCAALSSTLIAGLELARDGVLVLDQDAAWTPVRVRRHDCGA